MFTQVPTFMLGMLSSFHTIGEFLIHIGDPFNDLGLRFYTCIVHIILYAHLFAYVNLFLIQYKGLSENLAQCLALTIRAGGDLNPEGFENEASPFGWSGVDRLVPALEIHLGIR